jgi:rhamnulokinase
MPAAAIHISNSMTAVRKMLAIDLGAESGRGIVGLFDGVRLNVQTVHRFANRPVQLLDQLVWDAPALFAEIQTSLGLAVQQLSGVDSIGVDTWGVDFALLGRGGTLLGLPRHYRDPHTERVMENAFASVPKDEIYRRTGLQFLRFNTLYQLLALQRDRSPLIDRAESLLFMPDLFHYWLTGIKVNEFTDAGTSQMVDPRSRRWDFELTNKFQINSRILGSLIEPGTKLGPMRAQVAAATGGLPIPVIAPATHDTASAVAAVPAVGDDWAYLSSGTWSLLGAELQEPIINDATLAANFTNEGGLGGTTRFLKNIMGLWLVQECRRSFGRAGHEYTYETLMHQAGSAEPFRSLIDPDHSSFLAPADMPTAINQYCQATQQPKPESHGAYIRCCLESLALKYRWVLDLLETLTQRKFNRVHIVGGGGQNILLNQFTAAALDRPVLVGPTEATAIGNLMVQALGLGLVSSAAQIRDVVRQSVEVTEYLPLDPSSWGAAYLRFQTLLARDTLG